MKENIVTPSPIFTLFSVFHKDFPIPNVSFIQPIHGGKALSTVGIGIEGDDTGDNISHLNPNFSELTAVYYIWKNYNRNRFSYWGLCHYRRYFCTHLHWSKLKREYNLPATQESFQKIFTSQLVTTINQQLTAGKVIAPLPYKMVKLKKWSVRQQYIKDHDEAAWKLTQSAIEKLYPEYLNSFVQFGNGLSFSCYNMLIASWEFWDQYLEWAFNIFLEVKKSYVVSTDPHQARVFGFLGERLISTFMLYKQETEKLQVAYLPIAKLF